jgi:hypothetical protein
MAATAWVLHQDWLDTEFTTSPLLTPSLTWSRDPGRHLIRSTTQVHRDQIFGDLFRRLAEHHGLAEPASPIAVAGLATTETPRGAGPAAGGRKRLIAHALDSGGKGNDLSTEQATPVVLVMPGRAGRTGRSTGP